MPIYGFECGNCGHQFDRLQKLSDADPTVCPECGAEQLRRQLTAPSFRLSGSGWYETDFKKDGDKKRNLVEGSSGGEKPESKGDAKDAKRDGKSSETKSVDAKPAESKSTESKPSESKPTESRSGESKPAPKVESKPASKPATD
jgi:putative FmdB family regulatory protein